MEEYTVEELRDAALTLSEQGDTAGAKKLLRQANMKEAQAAATAAAQGPTMAGDIVRAGAAGAARGAAATAQLGPTILDFMTAGLPAYLAEKVFGAEPTERVKGPTIPEQLAEATGGATEYRGRTLPAQYAGTIGEFAGGAATLPIGGLARSVGSAVLPAIASETAGQITAGTKLEGPARMMAALGTPFAQAAVTPALRRSAIGDPTEVRGYMAGTQRPQSVELLRRMGIEDISAGQELGSEALMRLEGRVGPSTPARQQVTQAVLREAGTDAPLATPDVMKATRDRLGSTFDMADAMAGGAPTRAEGGRMIAALDEAEGAITVGKVPNKLKDIVKEFGEAAFAGDAIDPRNISTTRSNLNKAMTTYASSGDMINYELAYDLLQVLDDMVERQLRAIDPEMVAQLGQARQQYRSFLTAERALNRGGSDPASGIISPDALASAVRRREGVSYMRGTGSELAELARASQEVLTPLPAVSAGGIRDVGGVAQKVMQAIPAQAARTMQETLPMPAREAITQRLLERLARQTGGILSID